MRPRTRLSPLLFVALVLPVFSATLRPAAAQYLYLDANGDGIHSEADVVLASGTTTVDVWLRTDGNRDGSPSACSTQDGDLTLYSYEFILRAQNGTVTWGSVVNEVASFPQNYGTVSSPTDLRTAQGGGGMLPPGLYKLASFTVAPATGTPSLAVVPSTALQGTYLTGFASSCSGSDYDGTLKLGTDWFDADGLAYGGVQRHPPVLGPIADMMVDQGQVLTQSITATDVDGEPLTFAKAAGPAYMSVTTSDPGTGNARGEVRLSPGFTDWGMTTGSVGVTDGLFTASGSFSISINQVHRPVVLNQPRDMSLATGTVAIDFLFASDPDGLPITFSKAIGPAYMSVTTYPSSGGNGMGLLQLAPGLGDAGDTTGTVAASDGWFTDQKSFQIHVRSTPILAALQDMTVAVNSTADQTLRGTDADGVPLEFSRAAGPYFVTVETLDPGTGQATGVAHVAPQQFDAGATDVTISVSDGTYSAERSFRLTVTPAGGGPSPAPDLFTTAFRSYDTGPGPRSLAAGDLNGDGWTDLVAVDYGDVWSNTISILMGQADGTFAARRAMTVADYPVSIALCDLNRDGSLDLAVVGNNFRPLEIYPGNGDGTFRPAALYASGSNCHSVVAGDWDGDGFPDLALTDNYHDVIRAYHNRGDGTFEAPVAYPAGSYPEYITAGDFNGDGRADLVVENFDGRSISLFLATGQGAFAPRVDLTAGSSPSYVAVCDLNRDGFLDLAVSDPGQRGVLSLLGHGDGTFTTGSLAPTVSGPSGIAVADVNSDGVEDLIVACGGVDMVSLLLGNGDGTFRLHQDYAMGPGPISVAAGDWNHDGAMDAAAACSRGAVVAVLSGDGHGGFMRGTSVPLSQNPVQAVSLDWNGDPFSDLAVLSRASGTVIVELGQPDGTLARGAEYRVGDQPRSMAPGDFDGDQRQDLAVANFGSRSLSIIRGGGQGGTAAVLEIPLGFSPILLAVADFNRDGRPDIVVTGDMIPAAVAVFLSHGDGTFDAPVLSQTWYATSAIAAGDVDGDGVSDVVLESHSLRLVLHGKGDGTFTQTLTWFVDVDPAAVLIADLNGDHRNEVAVADGASNSVCVSLGMPDGSLGPMTYFPTASRPTSLAAGDFNGDGIQDLAAASGDGNCVSVLLGNGDGTFGTKADYGAGSDPASVAAGDWNGDGRLDLATANAGSNTVSVLLNRGMAHPNRAPVASAGGPYAGVAGVPIAMSGARSSDPDGDPLAYHWYFGDGAEGVGVGPLHTYLAGGTFTVALDVSDGNLTGRDSTQAAVTGFLGARAFQRGPARTYPLMGGVPSLCLQLEPLGGSFQPSDVVPSTIRLLSSGTGEVGEIPVETSKSLLIGDTDHNGIPEISACFARGDLERIFSEIRGRQAVEITLRAGLVSGASAQATLTLTLIGGNGASAAYVYPNPLNPAATLRFRTGTTGLVSVRIYDGNGRLVRRVLERSLLSSGLHDVPLDGRSDAGQRLASGVYFYRIDAADGITTGRIAILK